MMSSDYHQPVNLSSINPSRHALSLSPSSSNRAVILYASGLLVNILDPVSWRLLQSINLVEHLPHLPNYQNLVDVVYVTEDNRRLAVSCGPLTAIFERPVASSTFPFSWKLHSTFTCHIARILSINLEESYCLVTGEDGMSLYQLEQVNSDLDEPARWTKRWALRGQPCDQAAFEVLEDGTCVLAAIVIGSPILRTYEFSIGSSNTSSNLHQYSPKLITLSLPIQSIRFSYRRSLPSNHPNELPFLSVEVVAPKLGVSVQYYDLIKRPLPVTTPANPSQQPDGRYKPSIRYLHHGMCAISVPVNSPRILAVFPLDNLAEHFISQNKHIIGHNDRLNLIVLSNGEVNLARSTKNTNLLSSTPFLLPEDMLELFMRPGTKIQRVMSVHNSPGEPCYTSCSIVARPLKATGEIFIAQISLDALLDRQAISSSSLRLVSMKQLPFGYTPLFTRASLLANEQATFAGLLVTGSTKDEDTRYICLCYPAKNCSVSASRLLAYATCADREDAPPLKSSLTGGVQAAGCFSKQGRYCKADRVNLTAENSHIGTTGLFVSYLNCEIHLSVQPLSYQKVGLKGFLELELPKELLMECSSSQQSEGNSVLCFTSSNRLLLWNIPGDLSTSDYDTQPYTSCYEVLFPASFLPSTLTQGGCSPTSIVLALDTNGQLVQALLAKKHRYPGAVCSFELKVTMCHQIGTHETLGLTDIKSQVILLEPHESRFIAMLCVMNETDRHRTYRIVVVDLKQQPYSPGIVGLDTFEVEQTSINEVQIKWSDFQRWSNSFQNSCLLAVCCGTDLVRIYTRANDGWWTQTTSVHSGLGSISQISWLAVSDHSTQLLYQTAGHTILGPQISLPQRLTLTPWHPVLLKNQLLFGRLSLSFATVACLSLALKGCLEPLTLLCQSILTVAVDEYEELIVKELGDLTNDSVLPGNLSPTILSEAHVDVLSSAVSERRIPLLSENEQDSVLHLAKAFLQVQTARSHGIDAHGCQYIFSLINHLDSLGGSRADWELGFGPSQNCGILSAQLSSTQGLIGQETSSILSRYSDNPGFKLDWKSARSVGLFMWLDPAEEVHLYLERIAQAEYVSGGSGNGQSSDGPKEQDPAACSIFYMALRKKRLLMGLWKVAYGHADRPLMTKFLENDFSEARWKTAAQKNAFALISRQRFRFAASFFLLADRLQDAVNVCVRQLSDWQLALAIVRAYEGDRGPAMNKLLAETVIPIGFSTGNRWLVSWSFRMLGQSELSCRVLVAAWDDPLVRNHWTPSVCERYAVRIGPLDISLVVLFSRLKRSHRSPLIWTDERALILLSLEELTNAGCTMLAVALAKDWHIDPPDIVPSRHTNSSETPPDNTSSLQSKSIQTHSNDLPPPISLEPLPKKVLSQPVVPEFELSNFF